MRRYGGAALGTCLLLPPCLNTEGEAGLRMRVLLLLSMDFYSGRQAVLNVLKGVRAGDLPRLLHWMRTTNDFDAFTSNNDDVILRCIAEDLRQHLPLEAVFSSEQFAIQKLNEQSKPTVHIDAFLYDDDCIDSLCEEGKMSRNYCLTCGSSQTAPLEFISHSFSLMELKFLYQHVLPDLTGKVLVDVGSRLGAVLFGVLNADICTQAVLLQNADVVVMNNVFEYFLDRSEQARVWKFISQNVRKKGSLLVTVPALENSLSDLQVEVQLSQWVEALPLNYDVFSEEDKEALEQIHLYKIL